MLGLWGQVSAITGAGSCGQVGPPQRRQSVSNTRGSVESVSRGTAQSGGSQSSDGLMHTVSSSKADDDDDNNTADDDE
jgi:hypothetical protein